VFKRFDLVFAAAVAVSVAAPLAWQAGVQREHRRMLERVGAEVDAKFQARQALELDLVGARAREIKRMVDKGSYGEINSPEYRRDQRAVYAKHGVKPPPELADGD
jgi:hypothetical protein